MCISNNLIRDEGLTIRCSESAVAPRKEESLGVLVVGRGSRTWIRPLKSNNEMEMEGSALVQRGYREVKLVGLSVLLQLSLGLLPLARTVVLCCIVGGYVQRRRESVCRREHVGLPVTCEAEKVHVGA